MTDRRLFRDTVIRPDPWDKTETTKGVAHLQVHATATDSATYTATEIPTSPALPPRALTFCRCSQTASADILHCSAAQHQQNLC